MSSAQTEDIARQFIQAWNAGHLHVVDELAADNLTVSYTHFPEPFHGPEEFKEMLSQTHRYFPDRTIEIDEVVADGDRPLSTGGIAARSRKVKCLGWRRRVSRSR
jgi:predicted ester cyclase